MHRLVLEWNLRMQNNNFFIPKWVKLGTLLITSKHARALQRETPVVLYHKTGVLVGSVKFLVKSGKLALVLLCSIFHKLHLKYTSNCAPVYSVHKSNHFDCMTKGWGRRFPNLYLRNRAGRIFYYYFQNMGYAVMNSRSSFFLRIRQVFIFFHKKISIDIPQTI